MYIFAFTSCIFTPRHWQQLASAVQLSGSVGGSSQPFSRLSSMELSRKSCQPMGRDLFRDQEVKVADLLWAVRFQIPH